MLKFLNKLLSSCLSLTISLIVCGIAGFGLTYCGMSLIAETGLVTIVGWVLLVVGLLCVFSGVVDLIILFFKSIINKKWWYLVVDIIFIALYAFCIYYLTTILLIFSILI